MLVKCSNAHQPHHISHVHQNEVWNDKQKPNKKKIHEEKQIIKANKYNEMENKTWKTIANYPHTDRMVHIGCLNCTHNFNSY